jgi:hypothetical protein
MVGLLEAQGVSDHHEGQPRGHVGHEVALPLADHPIQEPVDDRAHLVCLAPDLEWREAVAHELATLPVHRVVLLDHHPGRPAVRTDAADARPQVRTPRDVSDVVVLRDAPHARGHVPVDRIVLAQPGERGMGITRPEVAAHVVQVELVGCHAPAAG